MLPPVPRPDDTSFCAFVPFRVDGTSLVANRCAGIVHRLDDDRWTTVVDHDGPILSTKGSASLVVIELRQVDPSTMDSAVDGEQPDTTVSRPGGP